MGQVLSNTYIDLLFYKEGARLYSLLHTRKLRHREVMSVVSGCTVRKCPSWDLNPGNLFCVLKVDSFSVVQGGLMEWFSAPNPYTGEAAL